ALKLLRLSNSTVYNRGEQCDSIKKAVLRIGGSQIKQAVMNLSVIDQFSCSDAMGGLDTKHFWEHAIACGLIAGRLAKPRGDEFADSAMTMGLLHDIGRMILAHAAPDEYRQVLETARSMELPLEQVEKRMLMMDHAEVMDRILRTWQFPKALFNPIVFHHLSAGNIRRTVPQESQEAATLALANCLAHAMLLGSSGNETIYPIEDLCDMLRLDPKQLLAIEREVPDETSDLKFSMLSRSDLGSWTERDAEWADAFGCEFRPLVVSLKPEFDSIRILCERLKDPMQVGKPNIALVRIRNARDRVPVGQALVDAERAAGVENLPVIAISAGGELALEHGLVSKRVNRNMRIPFAMSRLVRTVREVLEEQERTLSAAA
ncbi:MAG: HDOD domain-containing protein, partial [Phycisphaeraceae bacterium]